MFLCFLLGAVSFLNVMAQSSPSDEVVVYTTIEQDSMPTVEMLAKLRLLRTEIDALAGMIGSEGERKFNDAKTGQSIYDSLLQYSNELDDLTYTLAEAIPFDEEMEVEEVSPVEEDSTTATIEDYETDDDVTNVKPSSKAWKPTQLIGFGVGSWRYTTENADNLVPNAGKSWFFDFSVGVNYRLGGEKSPLSLGVGLGFLTQNFNLGDQTITVTGDNALTVTTVPGVVKRSTYLQNSFYVPLTLSAKVGKKMKVFAGGYAGYALPGKTKTSTTFESFGSAKREETITRNYHATPFQYGAMAGINYKFANLMFRYQASEMFTGEGISDAHPWSIGLYLNGK